MAECELLAALLELGQRHEAGLAVAPHAAGVVVDDVFQTRTLGPHVEQLVDLLLVLGDREADLGMIDDVRQLLLDRVLVERDRHPSESLDGEHGPVELGSVVADDGRLVATREAEGSETQRDPAAALVVIPPRVRLPDPVVFLADCDLLGKALGIPADELRERIRYAPIDVVQVASAGGHVRVGRDSGGETGQSRVCEV